MTADVQQRPCDECGALFETLRHNGATSRKFCGGRCRRLHNIRVAAERTEMDPEPSPDVWDGETRFNDLPRLRDYDLTCMLCGRGKSLRLTDTDARLLPARRCQHCGGRVTLELDAGKATLSMARLVVRDRPAVLGADTD